jgi:hypothetical protein
MALNLFGGRKPDHPLADEKSTKEALAALPKTDPEKALEEVRDWIISVGATEEFKPERRADIYLLLDEAALAFHRKLTRDFVASPSLPKTQETRIWRAVSGYWKDLAAAYVATIDQCAADNGAAGRLKGQLPLLCTRAIRALGAQLKWQYMHYEPEDAETWKALGRVYRFAEQKKLHLETPKLYGNSQQTSSAEREFVKLLMLAASCPDCLPPLGVELGEWIIAHLGASFILSAAHQPQITYNYFDIAGDLSPKRLVQAPPALPTLRFFAAGPAAAQLDNVIRVAEGGALPSDLVLGGTYDCARVLGVLKHLKICWSTPPSVRKSDRYEIAHRLNVTNGPAGIAARLRGEQAPAGNESWVTENISAGGVGALVSNVQGDWIGVGKLVALSVEGGSGACSVGIVRRWNRRPKLQAFVGIRTLAKSAFPVTFGGVSPLDAILLNDDRTLREEVLVCMREGAFDKRIGPVLDFEGGNYLLVPVGIEDSGDDFDIARYRVMRQT